MREREIATWGVRWVLGPAVAAAAVDLALLLPAPASADLAFCPPGAGAGQCGGQSGVAADFGSERLYVADTGNNRIDVFEADGTFLFAFGWGVDTGAAEPQTCTAASTCQAGIPGSGDGQFKKPTEVAVDNDGASASHHDVYVFDSENFRLQKFGPNGEFLAKEGTKGTGSGQFNNSSDLVAVGPGGAVYLGDTPSVEAPRIEIFEPSLTFKGECELPHKDLLNIGLAVDSAGIIYAAFNKGGGIFRFEFEEPECKQTGGAFPLDPATETSALGVDGVDHLFAAQGEVRVGKVAGSFRMVTEYEADGTHLSRFGYGFSPSVAAGPPAIAPLHTPAGDVFASLSSGLNRIAYLQAPPPGPVIAPLSLESKPSNTKATLRAELNPEGVKPTKYRFQYVDLHSFETEGGFASPNTKQTAEVEATNPAEGEAELFELHAAEAIAGCPEPLSEAGHPGETEIEAGNCLTPETKYRFRALAKNGAGESSFEGEFETKEPLEITETWASQATTSGARLNAKVDAQGVPTSGYFEYVDEESFQESGFADARQVPDVAHGQSPLDFGSGEAAVRGAALDGLLPGRAYRYRLVATDELITGSIDGPVRSLRPFAKPAVAPCANDTLRAGAGALLPDCRGYEMVSPLDKGNGDILPLPEAPTAVPAALNESATSGEKVAYASYRAFGNTLSAPYSAEYVAERGAGGWSTHAVNSPIDLPLNLPLNFTFNTEFKLFSPDLCQLWQRTVAEPPLSEDAVPGYSNIYRRTDQDCAGGPSYEAITTVKPPDLEPAGYGTLELQGASADGNVAIYAAPDNLTNGIPAEPPSCVSEGKGCQLRLYEKRPGQKPKFLCILPGGEATAPCEAGSGGAGDGQGFEGAVHGAISADGKRIYWSSGGKLYLRVEGKETLAVSGGGEALSGTSSSRFKEASTDGLRALYLTGQDLYRFDAPSKESTLIAHGVKGVAGASEDLSHIYFVSTEALTATPNSEGDEAQAGKPNLYLDDEGAFRFVATLASADVTGIFSPITGVPIYRLARVSPDGQALAFLSTAPLTGYDNTDAASPEECGQPQGVCDAEAFLYDARGDGGTGKLACASCNPTGERPSGTDIAAPINKPTFMAAAKIPAWENNQYAPRALSADGRRLFFESSDALSPLDSNGVTDVYEWEAAGEGKCTTATASYDPASGGCLDLISSGKSPRESNFLDADPSGENAFFTTLSSLVPQDDGLIDVYDAREGGGFPAQPPPKAECEGEACQSPPGPPAEQTPASSLFGGEKAPEQAKAKKKHKKHKKHKQAHKKKKQAKHKRRAGR